MLLTTTLYMLGRGQVHIWMEERREGGKDGGREGRKDDQIKRIGREMVEQGYEWMDSEMDQQRDGWRDRRRVGYTDIHLS